MLKENPDGSVVDVDISGSGRVRTFFYGGYGDAERRVLVILPEYAQISDVVPPACQDSKSQIDDVAIPEDCPLCILKVRTKGGMSRKLTHRDYLGSLLGLGIKREKVGDILVLDDGADIIVLKELSEFLAVNYEKAGRTNLNVEICDITALDVGKINIEERRDTVASLRLDSLVSSVFGISRGKAQEAIKMGLVFVNSAQVSKADMMLDEGDKIVLRGRGKAVLREVAGRSKKDRIYVVFDKYI